MKLIYLFITLISVQGEKFDTLLWINRRLPRPGMKNETAITPDWELFQQKLNNFDESYTKYFNMRYLVNAQFFKMDGPIFIMLGGEREIDPGWLQSGQMFDMAAQNNAIMFYLEHRYYGDSKPYSPLSLIDYPYLNSKQALADYAAFIIKLKKNYVHNKVVVFGGSYAGNLAIWMRFKYPNLVDAAVSSSAPIQAKVKFEEYFHFVERLLFSRRCVNTIKSGMKQINKYLFSGSSESEMVQKDLNLCQTVNSYEKYDLAYLHATIASEISNIVQNGIDYDLINACRELINISLPNHYVRLTKFIKKRRDYCIENYNQFIHYFSSYTTYKYDGYRQWLFQTCNEFGFFQTSAPNSELFYDYFPVDLNYKYCKDLFGYSPDRIAKGVNETNMEYHGLNISVTRVITVYGGNDPWSILGLKTDMDVDSPVIIIPGASHCQDLFSLSPKDSDEMVDAKLRVQEYVKRWLNQTNIE